MTFDENPSADIHPSAAIGEGTKVWHLAQVRENAAIGDNCVIGRGAYVGTGVAIGNNCKIQNYALVYEPANLADGVFVGPGAVLTNDTYPRATTPDGRVKNSADWTATGVRVNTGASIGASATVVAPVTVGEWAVVAAGATVVKDVAPHSLVAGVPAIHLGWVGFSGRRLLSEGGVWVCPDTGDVFEESDGRLRLVSGA